MSELFFSSTTSTLDVPGGGLLLRVFPEGDGFCAKDLIGLRFGYAETLRGAVEMWVDCVLDVCDEPNAGGALLKEQQAYKKALGL